MSDRALPSPHEGVRPVLCSVGELFGGVERQLLDLCEYGRRRTGASPPLVLFHDRELARQARQHGFAVKVLTSRHRYDPTLPRRLADALREHAATVIHAHGYKAMIACALAGGGAGAAIVKTEHGRPEATAGSPLLWARSRMNRRLDDIATRRADVVCYVTEDMARYCSRVHDGLRRETIANGIEPLERSGFTRPEELPVGRLNLGIVGRVTEVKGIDVALRALADPVTPRRAVLHVIGTGPLESQLAREARSLGVGDSVKFHGFRRDALHWIAHLDALLMPSRHEGLPYVLLEAMALGTPVFASRVGGIPEALVDGETGVLCPVGDTGALASAVRRLDAEPAWGQSLGAAARKRQRGLFTLDVMGARYWNTYARALAARAGPPEPRRSRPKG